MGTPCTQQQQKAACVQLSSAFSDDIHPSAAVAVVASFSFSWEPWLQSGQGCNFELDATGEEALSDTLAHRAGSLKIVRYTQEAL